MNVTDPPDLPVLVVAFKRPHDLRRCLARLADIGVRVLYVAVDGPRNDEERLASNEIKAILAEYSGTFCLSSRIAEYNHGCHVWVSSSITWFFQNVEFGLIVEEDILVDSRFYAWCKELAGRLRNDARVMHINAFFPQSIAVQARKAHYSKFTSPWGWATWRRAWLQYDDDMSKFFEQSFPARVQTLYELLDCGWRIAFHYTLALQMVRQNKLSSWAHRWALTIWQQNGLVISPGINLSENIGVGVGATHTSHEDMKRFMLAQNDFTVSLTIDQRNSHVDKVLFFEAYRSNSLSKLFRMLISVLLPNGLFFWIRRWYRS